MGPDSVVVTPVDRDAVDVLFLRTTDDVEAFAPLWERLERVIGTRGRKFYGAFFVDANEYWVCVQTREGDDAAALGLESGTLPGGPYVRARLRGEPPEVYQRIAPTFDEMARRFAVDPARPGLEFYRQRDEIDCLLPVVAAPLSP
jgi:hypothetical protein